jgi:hypothetical protein
MSHAGRMPWKPALLTIFAGKSENPEPTTEPNIKKTNGSNDNLLSFFIKESNQAFI